MKMNTFIESIKIKDGIIYNIQSHVSRLEKTTKDHFDTHPILHLSNKSIPEYLRKGLVKCRIVYSREILSIEYQKYNFKKIEKIKIVEDNTINYQYKSTDRDNLNSLYEKKGDCQEILIVSKGFVTDCSIGNLVFRNKSGLYTPSTPLLAGTKRELLLQQNRITEKKIKISNISEYTEVFLINSMIDLEDNISIPTSQIIR